MEQTLEPIAPSKRPIDANTFLTEENTMFVTLQNKRMLTAMTFAGAFVVATLTGSGLVAADTAKSAKVNYRNGSKVAIQVFLYDEVGKLTVVQYNEVTPGGSGSSQVAVKYDGNVDLTYRVLVKNAKGVFDGEQHCKPIKTSAESASATTELVYEKLSKC
jgi:hypothetical protein